MLIPHKKSRKTWGCAIPRAALQRMEGWSACCALIEARPVWRHPWGAKTRLRGKKRSLSTRKRRIWANKRENAMLSSLLKTKQDEPAILRRELEALSGNGVKVPKIGNGFRGDA